MKLSHFKIRDFLIGLEYDSIEEDKGSFTIRRKVTMPELVEELQGFVEIGHNFPTFPACANPTVVYAYDMDEKEDADITGEVNTELEKVINRRKINGSNHKDNQNHH